MAEAEISNFAQFEQAAGKQGASFNPPAPPEKSTPVEEKSTTVEKAPPETVETEAEPAEPDTEEPERKPAGKSAVRKPALTEEHARLLKEVVELRKERRELQKPAEPTGPQAVPDKLPPRPKLSTFAGTLPEYEEALEKWEEQRDKWQEGQRERTRQEEQAKEQQAKITKEYGEKLASHLQAHPDYDAQIAETPLSSLMVDIVLVEGPQLGQLLIDDKAEAKRISNLPRDVQIFEMGKLAARLNGHAEREVETEPVRVKVPARLQAVGSTSKANDPGLGAKNFAQYEAALNRQKARK